MGLLGLIASPSLGSFASEVDRLNLEAQELSKKIVTKATNPEGKENVDKETAELDALLGKLELLHDDKFDFELRSLLKDLYGAHGLLLQNQKDEIKAAFEEIQSTADRDESILQKAPHLNLSVISESARGLLRMRCQFDECLKSVEIFETMVAQMKVIFAAAQLNHVLGAVKEGRQSLDFEQFSIFHQIMEKAFQQLETFFPGVPVILPGKVVPEKVAGEYLFYHFGSLKASPDSPDSKEQKEIQERVGRAFREMEAAYAMFMGYLNRFPRQKNDESARVLVTSLFSVPGATDCLNLSEGKSTFRGTVCQPYEFLRLKEYTDFYDRVADSGLSHLVMDEVRNFLDRSNGKPQEADWEALSRELKRFSVQNRFASQIKKKWPEIVDEIVAKGGQFRTIIAMNHPGQERYRYLRGLLFENGIDLAIVGNTGQVTGFHNHSGAIAQRAKQMLSDFDTNVTQFFERESKLGKLPKQIERLDGSYESCWIYGKKFAEYTPKASLVEDWEPQDFIDNSPWVTYSVGIDDAPSTVPGPNGISTLEWKHKVEFGNAVQISEKKGFSKEKLAGLLVHQYRALVLPNLIQYSILAGDMDLPLEPEDDELDVVDLSALGVAPSGYLADNFVKTLYQLPDEKRIASESVRVFREIVRRYALRKGLMEPMENSLQKKDEQSGLVIYLDPESPEFKKIRREEFRKVQRQALDAFRKEYREQMGMVAQKLNRWDKVIKSIEDDYGTDAPPLLKTLFGEAVAGQAGEGVKNNRRGQASALVYFINELKYKYFKEKYPREDTAKMVKQSHLTADEFRSAVQRFGKAYLGSDLHYQLTRIDGSREEQFGWVRMYEYMMDVYFRRLDTVKVAKALAVKSFKPLELNDAYKNYRYFDRVMKNYLTNARDKMNYASKERNADEVLKELSSNALLTKLALTPFPQFKKQLCEIQYSNGYWMRRIDYTLAATSVVAAAVTVADPPVGVVAGMGAQSIALGISVVRAKERWKEVVRAEDFAMAASGQIDYGDERSFPEYLDGMKSEAYLQSTIAAGEAALLVGSVLLKREALGVFSRNLGRSTLRTGLSGWRAMAGHAGVVWAGKRTLLRFWSKDARELVFGPMIKAKWLDHFWANHSLINLMRTHKGPVPLIRAMWEYTKLGFDIWMHTPFGVPMWMAGIRFGAKAWAVQGLWMAGQLAFVGYYYLEMDKVHWNHTVLGRLDLSREEYQLLRMAQRSGYKNEDEIESMILLDDKAYAVRRDELKKKVAHLQKTLDAEQRKATIAALSEDRRELHGKIEALKAKGEAGKNPDYWLMRKAERQIDGQLQEWLKTVK